MDTRLTAGGKRVLQIAANMAVAANCSEVTPRHLLAALRLEETPASTVLDTFRVTVESLSEIIPQLLHDITANPPASPLPISPELNRVLQCALSRGQSAGRPEEISTLDLLGGLLEGATDVAPFLAKFGLNLQTFLRDDPAERTGSGHPLPAEIVVKLDSEVALQRHSAIRIVDASLNRVAEGLRVLDDAARFHWDDAGLTRELKACRHELARCRGFLSTQELLSARDAAADVGTSITLEREASRNSLEEIVTANLKRLQEGMRSLEEYGKLLSLDFAAGIKQLRYRMYTLEQLCLRRFYVGTGLLTTPLYLLVTEELCHHGSGPAIRGALEAGVKIIQIREKRMQDRQLVEHARRVREWTRSYGALLIMNDRPDLAVLVEADGVHVGQEELSVRDVRKIVGGKAIVGVSTHSREQAEQAFRDGADYIGIGPVFPSTTKSFSEFVGLDLVREVTADIRLPGFAIGGIHAGNVAAVCEAGATGIAVSSAICSAENPEMATRELLRLIEESNRPQTSPP